MNRQEVLEKAIRKAIDNGWNGNHLAIEGEVIYTTFIFNHDFARALWGEASEWQDCIKCGSERAHTSDCEYLGTAQGHWPKNWQYHLQRMVIADDPITYLNENMGE